MIITKWICDSCGSIVNGTNTSPSECTQCKNARFRCLGQLATTRNSPINQFVSEFVHIPAVQDKNFLQKHPPPPRLPPQ